MDLSVLENENLPKGVFAFIEKEVGYFDKSLKVLKHDAGTYLTDPSKSRHSLYLFLEDRIEYCSELVVVEWSERDVELDKSIYGQPYLSRMPVFDLQVFMKLIPALAV